MRRVALLAVCLGLVSLTGCGSVDTHGKPLVVATTTQAADFVHAIAGDRVTVYRILGPNSDPHEYELRPRDVRALHEAKLIIRSGGEVDDWLGAGIAASGTHAPEVTLIDHVRREGDDPHWWQDPRQTIRATAALAAALERVGVVATPARYEARLRSVDDAIAACVNRLPPSQRELVTTHDAFAYYARRYGLKLIGTVIPTRTTAGQPSSKSLAQLTRDIRSSGVRTVFAEASVNQDVARAIAAQSGAHVGPSLYADTLGPAGSAGATYIGAIEANTRAIVGGLSGGRVRCRLP